MTSTHGNTHSNTVSKSLHTVPTSNTGEGKHAQSIGETVTNPLTDLSNLTNNHSGVKLIVDAAADVRRHLWTPTNTEISIDRDSETLTQTMVNAIANNIKGSRPALYINGKWGINVKSDGTGSGDVHGNTAGTNSQLHAPGTWNFHNNSKPISEHLNSASYYSSDPVVAAAHSNSVSMPALSNPNEATKNEMIAILNVINSYNIKSDAVAAWTGTQSASGHNDHSN